jgi:hypothetical protein
MTNPISTRSAIAAALLSLSLVPMSNRALAQGSDDVTVLLRSGERLSGRLEDLNNGTLFLRVSPNDQRRLAVGQVALIDYVGGAQGLPETETRPASGGDHVLVMRSSQLVLATLWTSKVAPGRINPTPAACTYSGQRAVKNVGSQQSRSAACTSDSSPAVSLRPAATPPLSRCPRRRPECG